MVPNPKVDIASGRVDDSRSVSQKNSQSEFFCETDQKSTMLPQAKRPSGLAPGQNQSHRVTREYECFINGPGEGIYKHETC